MMRYSVNISHTLKLQLGRSDWKNPARFSVPYYLRIISRTESDRQFVVLSINFDKTLTLPNYYCSL